MLALYLQGYSCEDIAKVNPGFGLGIIVRARVDHGWDAQRDEYIKGLMSQVRETVQKTQLESIRFAADGMAVFHKLVGDRYRRYLQTGNIADLGPMSDINFTNYKALAGVIAKMTGEKKVASTNPVVNVYQTQTVDGNTTQSQSTEELPDDPLALIAMLDEKKLS